MKAVRWIAGRNAGWMTMSRRARHLIVVSLVAAAVSAALLCLGYLLYQRLGLGAALGPLGVAILAGIVATASHLLTIAEWRRNRRP